jgi:hypothetical protein
MIRKGFLFLVLLGLVLPLLSLSVLTVPYDRTASAPVSRASALVVTNNTYTVNGDTSSPDALIAS